MLDIKQLRKIISKFLKGNLEKTTAILPFINSANFMARLTNSRKALTKKQSRFVKEKIANKIAKKVKTFSPISHMFVRAYVLEKMQ